MKAQAYSTHMAHLQQLQSLLFFWKLWIESNDAGFQNSKRHSNQRAVRLVRLAAGGLHLNIIGFPCDAADFGPELHRGAQATGKQFHQGLISALEAELAVAIDLFFGAIAFDE